METRLSSLENRIFQLECKLKAFSQRTKKEIIWKKKLEDWILQKFDFDLRLAVDLTVLDNEGTEDLENLESFNANSETWPTSRIPIDVRRLQQAKSCTNPNGSRNASLSSSHYQKDVRTQNLNAPSSSQGLSYSISRRLSPAVTVSTVPVAEQILSPSSQFVTITPISQEVQNRRNLSVPHLRTPQPQHIPSKRKRLILSTRTSGESELTTPIIVSTSTIAVGPVKSPEVIQIDDDDDPGTSTASTDMSGQGGMLPEKLISTPRPNISLASSEANDVSQVATNSQNSLDHLTHFVMANADSSRSNEYVLHPYELLQLETQYAEKNYLTRNGNLLSFNVLKILFDYDFSLHDDLDRNLSIMVTSQNMPTVFKKRITGTMSEFLMQVYGGNVPRVAKEAMAQSLFEVYPFVEKGSWYLKNQNRNPTGSLEHKINNIRRQQRDQRKVQEDDPGPGAVPEPSLPLFYS